MTRRYTTQDRAAYLRALVEHDGNVTHAAKACGHARDTVTAWRRSDENFAAVERETIEAAKRARENRRRAAYTRAVRSASRDKPGWHDAWEADR